MVKTFQIPLCELETEKGELEEKAVRTGHLLHTLNHLSQQGYSVEETKHEADRIVKEAMIKLFAVSILVLDIGELFVNKHKVLKHSKV